MSLLTIVDYLTLILHQMPQALGAAGHIGRANGCNGSGIKSHRTSQSIKELIPIIFAAALWGKDWKGWCVLCRCNNQAVVAVINARSSLNKDIMHLLRVLFFIEAHFDFMTKATHIPGTENRIADDISRNRSFSSSCQVLSDTPTPILEALINLIIREQPDWTCSAWTMMFNSIFNKD